MSKKENKGIATLKGSCLWGILIFGILLLIDLLTKAFAVEYFSRPNAPEKVKIIPDFVYFRLTYNRGIAYGMGDGSPKWAKIAVIAATGVLMLALTVFYFKADKRRGLVRHACVWIVAGGVGNLIDRIYYKVWIPDGAYGVRDMIDLSRFGFAVCNFADFFITFGAVALVLALLFFDKDALFPVGKYKKMAEESKEEKNG